MSKKDLYLIAYEIVVMGRDYREATVSEELKDWEIKCLDTLIAELKAEEKDL